MPFHSGQKLPGDHQLEEGTHKWRTQGKRESIRFCHPHPWPYYHAYLGRMNRLTEKLKISWIELGPGAYIIVEVIVSEYQTSQVEMIGHEDNGTPADLHYGTIGCSPLCAGERKSWQVSQAALSTLWEVNGKSRFKNILYTKCVLDRYYYVETEQVQVL